MMKHFIMQSAAVAVLLFTAASCSNQDMPDLPQEVSNKTALTDGALEAISVANDFLGRSQSRAGEAPEVLYVLNEAKSRSEASLPDTLAYVVNYPEKSGYAVVMNSDRPDRVLAFSETGNFSLDNEVVNEYFTSCIGSFMASTNGYGGHVIIPPICPGPADVEPFIVTPIYENVDPYNKYIQREEYNTAGTGSVAIVKAMLHAKDEVWIRFYNHEYALYCKSIRNAYKGITSGSSPLYQLYEAKDVVGQLIAEITKSLDYYFWMSTITSRGDVDENHFIYPDSAEGFMATQGYNITTGVTQYNFAEVFQAIGDGNVVVMVGKRPKNENYWVNDDDENWKQDYWVCDGRKSVKVDLNNYVQYIHCSWCNIGIGQGDNNGYFNSNCFDYGGRDVDFIFPLEYFAVKLENTEL